MLENLSDSLIFVVIFETLQLSRPSLNQSMKVMKVEHHKCSVRHWGHWMFLFLTFSHLFTMPQAETQSTGQGPAASQVAGDIRPARCSRTAPKRLWLDSPLRGRKTSGCFAATNLRHKTGRARSRWF